MPKMTPGEYYEHSLRQAQAQEEKRAMAWEELECKKLYDELIRSAGEPVRSGMRGNAKQLAITAYLRGVEPDYAKFAADVAAANKYRWKKG